MHIIDKSAFPLNDLFIPTRISRIWNVYRMFWPREITCILWINKQCRSGRATIDNMAYPWNAFGRLSHFLMLRLRLSLQSIEIQSACCYVRIIRPIFSLCLTFHARNLVEHKQVSIYAINCLKSEFLIPHNSRERRKVSTFSSTVPATVHPY